MNRKIISIKVPIFAILTTIAALANAIAPRGRIFGGQNATSAQFPFMVSINAPKQVCDGSIIAPSWILTSAQCVYYATSGAEIYVGSYLNQINGTAYTILDQIVHEDHDLVTWINDIGLIKINGTLEYTDTIQPIELGGAAQANATCTFPGWGETETEYFPENLQYVEETIIDLDLCLNISSDYLMGTYLGPEQVCGVPGLGKGGCTGDTGGPLVCDGKLAGVFSYSVSFDCGAELPEVFSSVEVYAEWIQTQIQD